MTDPRPPHATTPTTTPTTTPRQDLCIVAVHAHPDDESSKAAATIARYAAAGVRCVLVCCTDGRGGRDVAGSGPPLVDTRARELDRAADILGYASVHRLGHPDSGMDAADADGFAHVALPRVAAELLAILEHERPDVVITYDPGYASHHPDHQQAYAATVAAFAAFAERSNRAKLYGTRTHSPRKLEVLHQWLIARGESSPYQGALGEVDTSTTRIDVADHLDAAHHALHQHASQVDAGDLWFFAVPAAELRTVYPYEDLTLLAATVPGVELPNELETDLFRGLRT